MSSPFENSCLNVARFLNHQPTKVNFPIVKRECPKSIGVYKIITDDSRVIVLAFHLVQYGYNFVTSVIDTIQYGRAHFKISTFHVMTKLSALQLK